MLLTAEQAAQELVAQMNNASARANRDSLQTEFERFAHRLRIDLDGDATAVLGVAEGEAELFELLPGDAKHRRTLMLRLRHVRVVGSRELVASNGIDPGRFGQVELVHETLPGDRLPVNVQFPRS